MAQFQYQSGVAGSGSEVTGTGYSFIEAVDLSSSNSSDIYPMSFTGPWSDYEYLRINGGIKCNNTGENNPKIKIGFGHSSSGSNDSNNDCKVYGWQETSIRGYDYTNQSHFTDNGYGQTGCGHYDTGRWEVRDVAHFYLEIYNPNDTENFLHYRLWGGGVSLRTDNVSGTEDGWQVHGVTNWKNQLDWIGIGMEVNVADSSFAYLYGMVTS